jgi:hypothetical protein
MLTLMLLVKYKKTKEHLRDLNSKQKFKFVLIHVYVDTIIIGLVYIFY